MTVTEIGGRPAVRLERFLPHSVERVWRAVTDPDELTAWFVTPVTWTPSLGERREAFGGHGEITELEAPRRLAWTWDSQWFAFELHAERDGCRLVFSHVFDPAAGPAPQHAAGWVAYLTRLDVHLLGGALAEADAHRQGNYVEVDGRPAVRFHRRLAHPIERVWRAVTDPAELSEWFPCEVELDPRVGGAMRFVFTGHELTLDGRVTELVAPTLLAFDWGEEIRIELCELDDGATLLTFTNVLSAGADTAARTIAGWHICLDALEHRLGDPSAAPRPRSGPTPGWQAHYDAYVARGVPSGAPIPDAAR